jgi:hypothetical protein
VTQSPSAGRQIRAQAADPQFGRIFLGVPC